jgi:hypothetical protein
MPKLIGRCFAAGTPTFAGTGIAKEPLGSVLVRHKACVANSP